MEILHATVHLIDKEQHGISLLKTRAKELEIDPKLKRLALEVYKRYQKKPQKAYGKFNSDQVVFRFSSDLKQYREGKISFQEMSIRAVKIAEDRTGSEPLAVGGYYLFIEFGFQGGHFLLISVLRNKVGAVISDALEIENSAHLNVEDLSLVSLINVSTWESKPEDRYISFIRDRGDSILPQYFLKFLGAEEIIDTKTESEALCVQVVNYLNESQLSEIQRNNIMSEVAEYAQRRKHNNEPMALIEVSRIVDATNPEKFIEAVNSSDLPISGLIDPYMKEFRSLKQISLVTDKLTITFDRRLLNTSVHIDPKERTITFREISDDIFRQFSEER